MSDRVSGLVMWMKGKGRHTDLVEHLVALVEDEAVDTAKAKVLVTHESIQTTRGADNDVRVCLLVLENVDVLLDRGATVEDRSLHIGQVLAEARVLILDLERQLAGVAEDQDRGLASDRLDLLKGGQDEDSGLSETGLGLADQISSKDGDRKSILLDWSV